MPPLDPEFESDPDFALYHSAPATETSTETETEESWRVDIFGGIEPEKVLARYELVDASEEEQNAIVAMARVQWISDMLESTWERITQLTEDF
jgi:enoyl reductase-like protein